MAGQHIFPCITGIIVCVFLYLTYQSTVLVVTSIAMCMFLYLALQLASLLGIAVCAVLMSPCGTGQDLVPYITVVIVQMLFQLTCQFARLAIVTAIVMCMFLYLAIQVAPLRCVAAIRVLMRLLLFRADEDFLFRVALIRMCMYRNLRQMTDQAAVRAIAVVVMGMYQVVGLPAYQLISVIAVVRVLMRLRLADQTFFLMRHCLPVHPQRSNCSQSH
ncbi:MAG: hypothetical protein HFH55_06525 [Lachnospiraceae bacterium]|nr:hypothetical protein [Lachnospiraceae bacterium]